MNDRWEEAPYVNDIRNQPLALQETLAAFETADFDSLLTLAAQAQSQQFSHILLTGMGSSFHALHPLFYSLLRRRFPVQLLETSELIHFAPELLDGKSLVVAVSQSGASAEIMGLLQRLSPSEILIGVTNTPCSPLAERAGSLLLLTRAGSENSVSCKTYITALVALALLETILIGGVPAELLHSLNGLPQAVQTYLSTLPDHIEDLRLSLQGITSIVLAGRGSSQAAAGTGGLIIKEAAHFPSEGMSCAAYRHGPLDMASPQSFVVVYEGLEPTRALNRNLVADIHKAGGKAALVDCTPVQGAFHLPEVPEAGLPVLEILPAQMISIALALIHGHFPGQFRWGSKVTTRE